MFASLFRLLLISALVIAHPASANAQIGARGENGKRGDSKDTPLNADTTRRVIYILSRGFEKCTELPRIYRYDCYWSTYGKASEMLHGIPIYSEAYTALSGVQTTLGQIIRDNVDPTQKPLRRGFATYTAIQEAAVPSAKTRTEQALQQAQTILLRAPENKQGHYSQIANAVNSNKVLLRSALLPGGLLRFAWYLVQLRSA